MNDWTAGYVADIDYTYGYYPELSPERARLALLFNGIVTPEVTTACELGYGQGLSANFHAAATDATWYGTDFNPAQAGFAQELAGLNGSTCHLFDDAFEQFAARKDLPDFDFIGLHGIWSWISDENRNVIVDFIREKLKVGGILYISYNTFPGWASFAPMRHLMTLHAETIGSEGRGIVSRIDGALEFAEKMLETDPLYLAANPQTKDRLAKIKGQTRHYLAHEYFNKDWHPMHFADLSRWLAPAKVEFGCSAHLLDSVTKINFSEQQRALMDEIPDAVLKESVRDFMVNQQFRRDYWVKGARKLTPLERVEQLNQQRFVLQQHVDDMSLSIKLPRGEGNLNKDVYGPILELMSDYKIRSMSEIHAGVAAKGVDSGQVMEAMMVLATDGRALTAQDDAAIERAMKRTQTLNDHLLKKARSSAEIHQLVSPATGGGIPVNRFQQLFIASLKSGKQSPDEWAQETLDLMMMQGQQIVKEGKPVGDKNENLAELKKQAREFAEKRLPILKAHGIV